jgi:hypothetical protein
LQLLLKIPIVYLKQNSEKILTESKVKKKVINELGREYNETKTIDINMKESI